MLTKQAIRSTQKIYIDKNLIEDKDVIINLSKDWSENQEIFFRKMLQQGGEFTLKGTNFMVRVVEPIRNSKGELDFASPEYKDEDE
jgi:hypothetical protein